MLFFTVPLVKLLGRKQAMAKKKGMGECIIRPLPTALIDAEPSRPPHHPLPSSTLSTIGKERKLRLRALPPKWQFLIGGLMNLVIE